MEGELGVEVGVIYGGVFLGGILLLGRDLFVWGKGEYK